jgi:hypothetical protein
MEVKKVIVKKKFTPPIRKREEGYNKIIPGDRLGLFYLNK